MVEKIVINGINHLTIAVTDLNRSFRFYYDILGLTPLCRWHHGAYFLAGATWLCLSYDPKRALVNPCDYTHVAFDIDECDFDNWQQRLQQAGVSEFKSNTSEGASLYFCDPDGHKLEIHVGSWRSRLTAKLHDLGQWQDVEFFVIP
jgi:catechol 2,3-dioxygenase-like lactoylglutathione lyase family enzyme